MYINIYFLKQTLMLLLYCTAYDHYVQYTCTFPLGEENFEPYFGLVTHHRKTSSNSLSLKINMVANCNIDFQDVNLTYLCFMSPFVRNWNGLINVHRSKLIHDILSPRGGKYFCHNTFSNNDSCDNGSANEDNVVSVSVFLQWNIFNFLD